MIYTKILIIKHPARTVKIQEIAEADLVLLQFAHGTTYTIVRGGLGSYASKGQNVLSRDEVRRLL